MRISMFAMFVFVIMLLIGTFAVLSMGNGIQRLGDGGSSLSNATPVGRMLIQEKYSSNSGNQKPLIQSLSTPSPIATYEPKPTFSGRMCAGADCPISTPQTQMPTYNTPVIPPTIPVNPQCGSRPSINC